MLKGKVEKNEEWKCKELERNCNPHKSRYDVIYLIDNTTHLILILWTNVDKDHSESNVISKKPRSNLVKVVCIGL